MQVSCGFFLQEFKFYNNCSMDYAQFSLQIERIVL